jgi:kinesin family protein 5
VYNEDHLSGIKGNLISEKEKNVSLAKQIKLLHENIEELSKKNVIDIDKLKDNISQEVELKAKAKWKQEMDIISNDLQNRIKKVIELELALDDAKENYRILEQRLSQSDKIIIKRNDLLEKNIEYITKLYYELLSEKSNLSVQNQVLTSKITRLTEKVVFLEEQLKQKEMTKFVEERSFIDENGKLNNSRASRASRTSQVSGNIRKPIKGGTRVVYNFAN